MRAWHRVAIISIFIRGCMSIDRKIFEVGCAPPRRTEREIAIGYALPLRKHHYLGEITIQYGSGYERGEILRRLRVEAAQCGADGLLLGSFSRVDSKWKWADKNVNDSFDTSGYRLIVTLYRYDDGDTVAEPPATKR